MKARNEATYFVSGEIFNHTTGGTLCDRMVAEELKKVRPVHFIIPQIESLFRFERPLITGLVNNLRNLFRVFPRGSLLVVDHGVYRDCFIALNVWKLVYRCRVIGLVYHLDYDSPQMRGGPRLRIAIEKATVRAYDWVLTISRSTADQLSRLGYPAKQMSLMPVSRRFSPQPAQVRRVSDSVTLLFVGTIEPRKGLLDAVRALASYSGARSIIFNCVGSCDPNGGYARAITSAARQCPHLTFRLIGRATQEELANFFREADAFLFPSHWEGYGIAIEEAMCFGLPVIAYDAGAVPELVRDGITGWLVPLRDIGALAYAVAQCVDGADERQRRGASGQARVTQITEEQKLPAIIAEAIAKAQA